MNVFHFFVLFVINLLQMPVRYFDVIRNTFDSAHEIILEISGRLQNVGAFAGINQNQNILCVHIYDWTMLQINVMLLMHKD